MQITLDQAETQTLRKMLEIYMPDLRREAAATDLPAHEIRADLAQRIELCERLLDETKQLHPFRCSIW